MQIGQLRCFYLYLCRLGVIEEEREEDERKLNVAVAAVERMNVLVSKGFLPFLVLQMHIINSGLYLCYG